MDHQRKNGVIARIAEYVRSPSLRHIRDHDNIIKLADAIVAEVDRASGIWTKWEGARAELAKAAWPCWIPEEDLREFLNRLPGPELTRTDVAQRMRAFWEERTYENPEDDFQAACLAIYEREKGQGTDMPAIIGAIRQFIEEEEQRLRLLHEAEARVRREEEKVQIRQRFLAGADIPWNKIDTSKSLYCRKNGRAYRIDPMPDKKWKLFRIADADDKGTVLGVYAQRGDANKALQKLAYEPEPRWS